MRTRLLLLLVALSLAVPAAAQNPVSVAQWKTVAVDTNGGNVSAGTIRVVLATDQAQLTNALKVDGSGVTQPVSGTITAIQGTGSNLHIVCDSGCGGGTQYTQDGALTIASTVGTMAMGRASAAAPANVSADDDAVLPWYLRSGAQVTQPTFAGVLASTGTGAVGTGTARVAVGTDTATIAGSAPGTAGSASTNVVTVQGIAAMTKLLVTPDSVALPANQSVNAAQVGGTATDTNSGVKSAGTLRVVLATDQPQLTNKLLVTPDSVALPANQSVNAAQLAGTTTDTNSGNKSAGTLRVVLATDQPALTNKLLVTPDSVALPANQSVNISQMNGVTVTMGAGATGTGVQRVNDVASSATGAAPPASAVYNGGLGSGATGGFLIGIPVCDTFKTVSMTSATTTLMVTGVSGRHVRICALNLVTAIANNVALISGTGATCGTGTTGVAGGTTAANGWNFAANGGLTIGSGLGTVMQTGATGDSICIITSAAGPLAGTIAYAIY